jgi:quercetin dioxygenase-like cupin family protein
MRDGQGRLAASRHKLGAADEATVSKLVGRETRQMKGAVAMPEIIRIGAALELRFLQSKDDTGGSLDLFEMTVQPNARMPVPHYHESWDETIYGLAGTTTWQISGQDIAVALRETVFIKRGIVHGFANNTAEPATCLCALSPGVLGPAYFREIAALFAGGSPDPAKMKETMLRYGLVPAAAA